MAVLFAVGETTASTEAKYVIGTACMAGAVAAYSRAELTALAKTDFLTGLPNREELYRVLERELSRSDRSGTPVAVATMDLDGFEEINDGCGHQAGDEALDALASAWSVRLRPSDLLAGLGRDKFVLVMPGTGYDQARTVMNRLRTGAWSCSWSVGVAVRAPGEDANHLLGRADAALYEDKQERRQRATAPARAQQPQLSLNLP